MMQDIWPKLFLGEQKKKKKFVVIVIQQHTLQHLNVGKTKIVTVGSIKSFFTCWTNRWGSAMTPWHSDSKAESSTSTDGQLEELAVFSFLSYLNFLFECLFQGKKGKSASLKSWDIFIATCLPVTSVCCQLQHGFRFHNTVKSVSNTKINM